MNNLAIVIPTYKENLSNNEIISLNRVVELLYRYHIYIVTYATLNLQNYRGIYPNFKYLTFSKIFFYSINGYSTLLLTKNFYKKFNEYKYILIYQTDAFLFSDKVEEWLNSQYDYIGAPWINPYWPIEKERLKFLFPNKGLVGNGGFSLRKVSSFINVLTFFPFFVKKFLSHGKYREIHEDIFWSLWVPSFYPFFKIPDTKTALKFSFEINPSLCYKMNNYQLPLGCHAFEKHEPNFWREHLSPYGIILSQITQ